MIDQIDTHSPFTKVRNSNVFNTASKGGSYSREGLITPSYLGHGVRTKQKLDIPDVTSAS
jgi:hypothetical protein